MTRRWRAFTAAAALALAAGAACGSQGSDDDEGAAEASGADECDKPSQGVSDNAIKIGTSLPLSGGAAVAGEGFQAGLKAAVGEVNAGGGIGGRTIDLVILDDGFEAARSVANIRRLGEEEKVFAVVGPAGTANLPGSFAYLARKGMPMFAPVLPPDPDQAEVWLLGTGHTDQVRVIVDWLAGEGVQTVALLSQDNDLGAAFAAGIDQQAPKHGITLVASEKLEPNSTDVDSAVLKLKEKNPDAVISGTDNAQTALLLKEAKDLEWTPLIIGNSSSGGPGSPNTVGPAGPAAEGFYSSAILEFPTAATPEVQKYRAAMDKGGGGGQTDNSFALQDYASAQVLFHLIEALGDDLCWSRFQAEAESLSGFETGLIPPVSFGELPGGHSGTAGARIAQYTGGQWQTVTGFLQPKP